MEARLANSLNTLRKYVVVIVYRPFAFIDDVFLEVETVARRILWLADAHQRGGNALVADIDPVDSFHELDDQLHYIPTGWSRISFPSLWAGSAVSKAPMNCWASGLAYLYSTFPTNIA